MSEGVILGFDVRTPERGEDEPFKDVRGGEGVIFDFLRGGGGGGMDLFWNDPIVFWGEMGVVFPPYR